VSEVQLVTFPGGSACLQPSVLRSDFVSRMPNMVNPGKLPASANSRPKLGLLFASRRGKAFRICAPGSAVRERVERKKAERKKERSSSCLLLLGCCSSD
jgi:hypothetical protein